jgi:hypothetical protein
MVVSSANKIGIEVLFMILGHLYVIRTTDDPGQSSMAHHDKF